VRVRVWKQVSHGQAVLAVTTTPRMTWPWIRAPVPARAGNLRIPEARIGGAASRNANRAGLTVSQMPEGLYPVC